MYVAVNTQIVLASISTVLQFVLIHTFPYFLLGMLFIFILLHM